jgi:hypothetical protein
MCPRSPSSPPDPYGIRSRRSPELATANCELGYACRRWTSPPSDTVCDESGYGLCIEIAVVAAIGAKRDPHGKSGRKTDPLIPRIL